MDDYQDQQRGMLHIVREYSLATRKDARKIWRGPSAVRDHRWGLLHCDVYSVAINDDGDATGEDDPVSLGHGTVLGSYDCWDSDDRLAGATPDMIAMLETLHETSSPRDVAEWN